MKIKITKSEDGLTVKQLFSKMCLSARMVTRLKNKEKGITVNGEKKTVRYLLSEGDELNIEVEDSDRSSSIPETPLPLHVLYEDEWFLAVEKEPFMPIHPSRNHTDDTLASRVMAYFSGKSFVFRVLTRLDRDTSGIVLIAKDAISAARFSELLKKRQVKKEYLAICEGVFEKKCGIIDYNIRRPTGESIKREAVEKCPPLGENTPEGTDALTEYRVLKECPTASLVSFFPITGRTHQLRVHSLKHGHPILGDTLYSTDSELIARQALHAYRLTFIHPFTKEETSIACPPSEDIRKAERTLF